MKNKRSFHISAFPVIYEIISSASLVWNLNIIYTIGTLYWYIYTHTQSSKDRLCFEMNILMNLVTVYNKSHVGAEQVS